MQIFLASAMQDEIACAVGFGLADGVFTTPALLSEAGGHTDPRALLQDIYRATPGPVVASWESVHAEDMYRDGRELARISDQMIVGAATPTPPKM